MRVISVYGSLFSGILRAEVPPGVIETGDVPKGTVVTGSAGEALRQRETVSANGTDNLRSSAKADEPPS